MTRDPFAPKRVKRVVKKRKYGHPVIGGVGGVKRSYFTGPAYRKKKK